MKSNKSHIVILKNDAVGDLVHSLPTIYSIVNNDKVTKIKLNEAVNQADTLMKGRIVEDKQVVTLMRYYQLVKELKNV